MKIFFMITSSDSSAKGGHFRSCLTIAESISRKGADVEIINVGKVKSPVLANASVEVSYIPLNLFNFPQVIREIKRKIRSQSNYRFIAFDFAAFFILRHVSYRKKIPLAWVRCGGKNPKYSPYAATLFCFSKENFDFYKKDKKFENSVKYLFPNRVAKTNREALSELSDKLGNDYPIILRIGRIVANYHTVNQAALNLSEFLHHHNVKHNLVFIGYPDNPNAEHYVNLVKKIKENPSALLLEDSKYTKSASLFLKQASLVIGTGRGAMEAFVENVPVAVYVKEHQIPVLVNSDTIFDKVAEKNFSARATIPADIEIKNDYLLFFTDVTYRRELLEFQKSKRNYFDIDAVADSYIRAFESMVFKRSLSVVDYLKNLKIFLLKLIYIHR